MGRVYKKKVTLIFLIFMMFLIPLVSGSYAEWVSYGGAKSQERENGNVTSYMRNTQISDVNADFLNNNITQYNVSNFQNQSGLGNQLLIGTLDSSSFSFLVTNNDTSISFYTFGSFNETYNSTLYTSMVMPYSDVNQLSLIGERFAGIFRENSTAFRYLVYSLDIGTLAFSVDINVSIPNPNPIQYDYITTSGLKCDDVECYAMVSLKNATWDFYDYYFFNGSASITNVFNDSNATSYNSYARYPMSKVNGVSGTKYYMFFTDKHAVAFDDSFNIEMSVQMNYGGAGSPAPEFIQAGSFIRNSVNEYQIVLGTYSSLTAAEFTICDTGFTCSRLHVYNLSGTSVYDFDVSSDTSFGSPQTGSVIRGMALHDYDGDGYDDVWVYNGNFNPSIYIFKGSDGSELFSNETLDTLGTGATDLIPKMTLGTLTSSGTGKAFILYGALGYVSIHNPYSTDYEFIFRHLWSSFTGEGSCVSGDLDNDLLLDVACANQDEIAVFFGADYQFPVAETNITTGNAGFTALMESVEGLFPDSSDLTLGQRILFVLVFMVLVFFMFIIPALIIKNSEVTRIMIYIGLVACILSFFYFVAVGYISIGVLVTMVLIAMGLSYLKLVKGG